MNSKTTSQFCCELYIILFVINMQRNLYVPFFRFRIRQHISHHISHKVKTECADFIIMSGKRRTERITNFHFEYTLHNFAALETKKDDDSFEDWSSAYLGKMLDTSLHPIDAKWLSRKYSGRIIISLKDLKPSSVVVGEDSRTKLQPYTSGHLENAIILGLIGLEAALTQTLEYFYGESGDYGTAGVKLQSVNRLLKNTNYANMTKAEFNSFYRLIAGIKNKPESNGLIPLRNNIVHNGYTIPKNEKRNIVEYISAGRRFAYRLSNWIKSEPEKINLPPSRKKHRARAKTR